VPTAALPPPALAAIVAYALVALVFAAGLARAHALARRGPPRRFANGAPPTLSAPTRVAFLGDVQRGLREIAGPVVDALVAEGAALLVSSGDLASHGEAPYHGLVGAAFDRAGLAVPLLVAPGNHDVEPSGHGDPAPGRALFERMLGPRRWTARIGVLLLVGVDDAVAPLDDDLWAWVGRVVDAHAGPWLFVGHRPPRRMLEPGCPPAADRAPLFALFARRPPVFAISGHLARDVEATVDGVAYVVNAEGGDVAGGAWRAPPTFHLRIADVGADGQVTLRRLALRRRLSLATSLDQILVRAWSSGRRFPGLLFAFPARALVRWRRGHADPAQPSGAPRDGGTAA
jgi:hypothetical protein